MISNGKIVIYVRTRYHKVKRENKNVLHLQFTAKISMKILVKFHFFT